MADGEIKAWLYDAKGRDREVSLDDVRLSRLRADQLLWVDATGLDEAGAAWIADRLEGAADAVAAALEIVRNGERPLRLDKYHGVFSLVLGLPGDGAAPRRVGFVVGPTWLLSLHDDQDIHFLRAFRDQDKADTAIGRLSPEILLATLLDWHLAEYLAVIARVEEAVDRLDKRILDGASPREVLRRIVRLRQTFTLLRRRLSEQREVFYALARADLALEIDTDAVPHFDRLVGRLERTIDEAEHLRDVLIGSFDLFTSLAAHSTNDLVKALTFATVVIGMFSAVAGLLGMNFTLPLFETGMAGFAVVVGVLLVSAAGALWFARRRGWI